MKLVTAVRASRVQVLIVREKHQDIESKAAILTWSDVRSALMLQMACGSSEMLEMPALGRAFNLGMLYDARADKLVPGMTLWDHEKLQQNMTERPQRYSEFDIVPSDSISDKTSSLGVNPALKASFLSELITVDGSAKYLNDTKTSKRQARVTLQYKTTTHFRELTMNQLGTENIKHQNIFEKGLATHVVTAIVYGAQAFFVFDQQVSDSENLQDIQGNLQGEGALNMEDKDREKVNKFSCKFHRDFNLSQSPVTFEEAVRVYQDLPKLLGPNGEKAVPVKVWLLPLTSLDSGAAKLVRQISVRLVSEVEETLEELLDLEMKSRDVGRNPELQKFPQIGTKIKTFLKSCSAFKKDLQGLLAQKLLLIRGEGEEEAEFAEILKKRSASPFSRECLNKWISCKEKEIRLLKTFTNMMNHAELLSSQSELDDKVSDIKYAVCFVFTSLESDEPYLSALDQYLQNTDSNKPFDPKTSRHSSGTVTKTQRAVRPKQSSLQICSRQPGQQGCEVLYSGFNR
ncbi:hypothetical protein WMY93_020564 [Mugilogobius chulae]|uniref:SNTX thioredoxin-like domain-containing protein n=1 Tax=Mugilogobius chulae TaxID=88201 RepID=A0AAW0NJD0_9GOBI